MKRLYHGTRHWLKQVLLALRDVEDIRATRREVDSLYGLLYRLVHESRVAPDLAALQTEAAFDHQWSSISEGEAMLSDPWFKANVASLIAEHEVLIRQEWFAGREVLDAGCGGGRWSYGLAKLGARVTAVDVNPSALQRTGDALAEIGGDHRLVQTPIESLTDALGVDSKFDLVYSWGVLHHCRSYDDALQSVMRHVRDGGVLYLYLYGRESKPVSEDVALFKERVAYNSLPDSAQREAFLLSKVMGERHRLHQAHDLYAPLINRRLEFEAVKADLEAAGFTDITRTVQHTELFIRAVKGDAAALRPFLLPAKARGEHWSLRYKRSKKA